MAGVADIDRSGFSLEIADDEKRQIMIDGTAPRSAIHAEADLADAPGHLRRFAIGKRRQRDLFEVVDEFLRVLIDVLLMLRWDRHAKKGRADTGEHRGG